MTDAAPPRVRRDPRDRDTRGRPGAAAATAAPPAARSAAADPGVVARVDNPTCAILVVPDLEAGRLSRSDRALMAAARALADALRGEVVLLAARPPGTPAAPGPEAEGADAILLPVDAGPAEGLAEARVASVLAAIGACDARHVLFPETPIGGELGRRTAARLGERPATQARRISPAEVTCLIDGGRSEVTRPTPRILIPAPEAFAPPPSGPRRAARPIPLDVTAEPARARVIATLAPDAASLALTEADLIVSAGGGVTAWDAFHAVAALLGAAEAGSRVVCDAGHLPRARQVGVSGTLVSPRCYLAFGIAGASQHLQGIAEAERVVAVNADPHADMLRRADLAVVADAQAVLPALAARARARGARHAA
jgi:electron transfer flavoprotein alpha subunit